jgi:hypothetical protein
MGASGLFGLGTGRWRSRKFNFMAETNEIGELGESIVKVCFTRITSRGILFRMQHLGAKWPKSDFYIEIIDPGNPPLFFIVQVKATTALNSIPSIGFSRDERNDFAKYMAPTYLIGVDVNSEKAFAIFVKSGNTGLSGISMSFELSIQNLELLYDEIKLFWTKTNIPTIKSRFKSITAV